MKKYDLVIFGLTFFGTGMASVFKGETLIVEAKSKPGYEFIDSFHKGTGYGNSVQTDEGKEFSEMMLPMENVFSKTPYISRWISDKKINVLLFTNVLNVKKSDVGYIITLFNSYGKTEIFAKEIIDTRTDSYNDKKLGFITSGGKIGEVLGDSVCTGECDGYAVWEMDTHSDYVASRSKIYSMFEGECAYPLVAVADEFYKKADSEGELSPEGYLKRYSTFYDNPISAFDAGARFGGELR